MDMTCETVSVGGALSYSMVGQDPEIDPRSNAKRAYSNTAQVPGSVLKYQIIFTDFKEL